MQGFKAESSWLAKARLINYAINANALLQYYTRWIAKLFLILIFIMLLTVLQVHRAPVEGWVALSLTSYH